jgi:hypothetical protein
MLDNDEHSKRAFYHWAVASPVFHNAAFLSIMRKLFDSSKSLQGNHRAPSVLLHENNKVLYSSPHTANYALQWHKFDYLYVLLFGGWITGIAPHFILPGVFLLVMLPHRMTVANYYTFHAELMPHTEQVVFLKGKHFGALKQVVVDIRNLEKIEMDAFPSAYLVNMRTLDTNMIFRDMETKEIFVFDSNGLWNEETLKHRLLY